MRELLLWSRATHGAETYDENGNGNGQLVLGAGQNAGYEIPDTTTYQIDLPVTLIPFHVHEGVPRTVRSGVTRGET